MKGLSVLSRGTTSLLVIVGLVFPLALPSSTYAQKEKKLVFATGIDPDFGLVEVALAKGYFRKHGLDVTIRKFSSGVAGSKSVLAGETDLGVSGALGPISALAQGARGKIIASARKTTGPYSALVVSAEIKRAQDLLGKKVGVAQGSPSSHLFFDNFVGYHKLEGVNPVWVQPQEMMVAFSRGDIDGFFIWPPWWKKGLALRPGAHVLAFDHDNAVYVGHIILIYSEKLAADPDASRAVLRALTEAADFMSANRAEAVGIIAKAYNLTSVEVEDTLKVMALDVELSDGMFAHLCQNINFLLKTKKVQRGPIWEDVILPRLLKEVDPQRVTYTRFIDCR